MSALASKLPKADEIPRVNGRNGPVGECAVYGPGDWEDFETVHALRMRHDWAYARREVHEALGLTTNPSHDKFRYHFRGKCRCWSPDLKDQIEQFMSEAKA